MGLSNHAASRVGRIELGGFRLRRVLGEGSFGVAYLADQLGTDRSAVVKIAHPHLAEGPSGQFIRRRFEAEVRAASRVHHRSLITLFAAGTTHDGLPALATEYVPGKQLGEAIDEGLSRSDVQACFRHIAEGLAVLHEAGIVHRDLSPSNVIVVRTAEGITAKIIDLGVAKLLSNKSSGTHAVGTPRYMAPEQIRGTAEPASDLYALGALLYFALSGKEYLHELDRVMDILLRASSTEPPASLRRATGNAVTAEEEALVTALLDADPKLRPTAGHFLERWAALAPPSDRERPKVVAAPRVLIVDEGGLLSELAEHLRRGSSEVEVTADPRRASRVTSGEYALIVVCAHLAAVDPLKLVLHLEEHAPDQPLWVAGQSFGIEWQAVRRARCIVVPDDLAHLTPTDPRSGSSREGGSAPRPSGVRAHVTGQQTLPAELSVASKALLERGAELIAELGEASQNPDPEAFARIAEQLARLASAAGADRLTTLSRALHALAEARATTPLEPLLMEILSAYRAAARAALAGP